MLTCLFEFYDTILKLRVSIFLVLILSTLRYNNNAFCVFRNHIFLIIFQCICLGENGRVKYYIRTQESQIIHNTFSIDEDTGQLSATGLDYEEKHSYRFTVEAKDQGNPSLSGQTTVRYTFLILFI